MSAVDTAWLRMDGADSAMMIVSVLTTAAPVTMTELRDVLRSRLLCFPRFRQRPIADPLGASWHEAADFDLDAHIVAVDLPAPGGKLELEALAAKLAGERLDPARPLWQIHLVERYGAGSAWVMRLHHCYADGMAMIRVMLSLTGQDPGPSLAGVQETLSRRRRDAGGSGSPDHPGVLFDWIGRLTQPVGDILENALAEGARLLETGVHQLFHPGHAAALAVQAGGMIGEFTRVLALPDDPVTPLRGRFSGEKRVAWSTPLDLEVVRSVSKTLGCTVNDVLLATVAGVLGSHLRDVHRHDTRGLILRASVPINLRAAEEPLTLGNKFGLLFVDLPIGTRNPLQRAKRMHETMRALKGSLQPPMTLLVLGMLGMLPAAIQTLAIELFSRKGSLVASNVPGPQTPLYLCGRRIDEMYFWVPQSGSMGVGVSILSYAGKVYFGVIADRALLEDPHDVADRLGPEFARLRRSARAGSQQLRERDSVRPRRPARKEDAKQARAQRTGPARRRMTRVAST